MGNIELTKLEEKKRQLRAMRFQNDKVTPSPPPLVVPKKKNKYTPITWDSEAAVAAAEVARNKVIVGTSVALEKPYFRLTSVRFFVRREDILVNINKFWFRLRIQQQ
jgi:hypothetical protein